MFCVAITFTYTFSNLLNRESLGDIRCVAKLYKPEITYGKKWILNLIMSKKSENANGFSQGH